MTSIVTGTDGRSYVHEMAGEAPVFLTGTAGGRHAARAAMAGHARLVAWLLPTEGRGARRARVRLPGGQIVEVAAEAVCSAANIARAAIGPARRDPAAGSEAGAQAWSQRSRSILPDPRAEVIGASKRRPAAGPTAR